MTKITVETDDDDRLPDEIATELEPEIVEDVPVVEPEPDAPDLLSQLNDVRETTAAALDQVGDDIGDLQEVVAALVSAMDSVVDYLRDIHEAEQEEGHDDIPAPVESEQKVAKVKKELTDVEPNPRHRYRTAILGRSGGVYK